MSYPGVAPTQLQNAFNSNWGDFFNQSPGYSMDWAGGTLALGNNGTATYNPASGGNPVTLNSGMDWNSVYNADPNITNYFNDFVNNPNAVSSGGGYTSSGDRVDNSTGTNTGINFFQPNLYPTSSTNSGGSGSSSSGINWESPFMQNLLPQLTTSINSLPSTLNNYAQTIQDQQTNAARQMLGPDAFQGTLNDLAQRGMIDSSVAGSALANTAQPIMQGILNQGYSSNLAAQNARLNMPSMLAQIAQLGQESQGSNSSWSSSQSSNPLAPYQLASQMLLGLQ